MPDVRDKDNSNGVHSDRLKKSQRRYDLWRAVTVVLTCITVAAAFLMLYQQNSSLQATQDGMKDLLSAQDEQAADITELLQQQRKNDLGRNAIIDAAIRKISAEQYRALVAHDRRVEDLLRRNLALVSQEVNNPANKENRTTPGPMSMPAPAPMPATAPAPGVTGPPTSMAPRPVPSPAPRPSPCNARGKSGKCQK